MIDNLKNAIHEMLTLPREDLRKVKLMVIGCSTSEIGGGNIGKASVPEYGKMVARAVLDSAKEHGFDAAFQCCEHLNRALVVEREVCEKYGLTEVCVIPQPHAGGSCATAAWQLMKDPVVVEKIAADAGIDIGGTMIGMHLKDVAIPLRLSIKKIGEAALAAACTRPKLIGGPRAVYSKQDIR